MISLDHIQLRQIEEQIRNISVRSRHLTEELIDHAACEVEMRMSDGESFEQAWKAVQFELGMEQIKSIDEETLLLTNKYYAAMIRTMKFSGTIALALVSLGTLLKFTHTTGANIVVLVGALCLCLLFLPSAVFLNYKKEEDNSFTGKLILTLALICLCAGFFFKMMHWNGAMILLILGTISLIPVIITKAGTLMKLYPEQKSLIISGMVNFILFPLAILFKIAHWPGAIVVILTALINLSFLFLPLLFKYFSNKSNGHLKLGFILIFSVYLVVLTMLISTRNPILTSTPQTSTYEK